MNTQPKRNKSYDKTDRIYAFILKYKRDNDGIFPTIREIRDGANISSTSMVNFHLTRLTKSGRLTIRRRAITRQRFYIIPNGRWSPPHP